MTFIFIFPLYIIPKPFWDFFFSIIKPREEATQLSADTCMFTVDFDMWTEMGLPGLTPSGGWNLIFPCVSMPPPFSLALGVNLFPPHTSIPFRSLVPSH